MFTLFLFLCYIYCMEKYKKELDYSYTFGIFPTFELVNKCSNVVQKVMIHENLKITEDIQKLIDTCKQKNIPVEFCTKQIEKIAEKDNTKVIGVFSKFENKIDSAQNHIVLVNPSDMGNLGTILRTALGFNMNNIAIIAPCADLFNPKTIRASMGAIFGLNVQIYESFEEYKKQNSNHNFYPFMLQATKTLQELTKEDKHSPFALIFGNEGSGLDQSFLNLGTPIIIKHSKNIDSLNLPISVSMAIYEFTK